MQKLKNVMRESEMNWSDYAAQNIGAAYRFPQLARSMEHDNWVFMPMLMRVVYAFHQWKEQSASRICERTCADQQHLSRGKKKSASVGGLWDSAGGPTRSFCRILILPGRAAGGVPGGNYRQQKSGCERVIWRDNCERLRASSRAENRKGVASGRGAGRGNAVAPRSRVTESWPQHLGQSANRPPACQPRSLSLSE